MTAILRLEGLDVEAGAEDIRMFFKCLHIPTGGVYILGGSLGEAFVAFSTEGDALLATRYSGKLLKGSTVTLYPSSLKEVEHKLKVLLKRRKGSATLLTAESPQSSPDTTLPLPKEELRSPNMSSTTSSPRDPRIAAQASNLCADATNLQPSKNVDAFYLGMHTVLQNLQTTQTKEGNDHVSRLNDLNVFSTNAFNEKMTPEAPLALKPGYIRLFGLPATATKEVISNFFEGLTVKEAIVNVKLGPNRGCLVKFASEEEASEALLFNQKSFGSHCLDVRGATEKMWTMAKEECENICNTGESVNHDDASHKHIPPAYPVRRPSDNLLPSKLKKPRLDNDMTSLSSAVEYTVMIRNLPHTFTKTDIKDLLQCSYLSNKNVLHLLDKNSCRTDTAFVIFTCAEDYDHTLNLNGCYVGSKTIEVSSITKKSMRDMIRKARPSPICQSDKKKCNISLECKSSFSDMPISQEHASGCQEN
ncbi:RNA binding motif protein 12Ba [Antennarius striatus]|uniref:RNA binding motif protein 12Ba n=1 Tax=Antennarius striatus TaxID=241820 RepID=UPI0035B3C2FF